MTEFRSYPHRVVSLPDDGKVTGVYRMVFRGDGSGVAMTDAHVNDDKPAIDYRGESFLVRIELRRDANGAVTLPEREWTHVTRRSNWSDAPPSFAAAIAEAIRAHVETLWTDDLDRAGAVADACQKLSGLERDESDAASQLAIIRRKIRAERKRLEAAGGEIED